MDLKKHFGITKRLIDKALDGYLPSSGREPKGLHRAMRYGVFPGGKRLRAIIVLEAAQACAAGNRLRADGAIKAALPAACAVELVHTYSLVHDDLPAMDDDDYRRGMPSCHKAFGEANAILAGDGLLTLAFNIIASRMPPSACAEAAEELSEAVGTLGMVGGQAIDIEFQDKKKGRKVLERINRLKTARLFEASSKLGAIAAKGGARTMKAMADYGTHLGMAFQIVDDILDGDGSVKLFGRKKACRDARDMIEKAKAALKPIGSDADNLRAIADHVLERIK